MKRITVVIGHPRPGSFNHAIAGEYIAAARAGGAEVRTIDLAEVRFDESTNDVDQLRTHGPDQLEHLPVEIQDMINDVLWAQHLVFVHPVWWGTYPAVLKGFIDRVFLSGVVFKYGKTRNGWDKLLKGRTARIISTMDAPAFFDRFWYGSPASASLRRPLLWYCGVRTIGTTKLTPIRHSSQETRAKWLGKVSALGARDAS